MDKRFLKWITVLVTLAIMALATSLAAKKPPKKKKAKQPATVVIKQCKKKQPGVRFDHAKHVKKLKIACGDCHHTGDATPCWSAGCHAGKQKDGNPGCAEMSQKKNPYHLTCGGCHRKNKKGPTGCKQCHRK